MVVKILPLTEGEQEKQYVSLNLVVTLTEGMLLTTIGKSFIENRAPSKKQIAALKKENNLFQTIPPLRLPWVCAILGVWMKPQWPDFLQT